MQQAIQRQSHQENGRIGGEDVTKDVGSIRSKGANEKSYRQWAGDASNGGKGMGVEEGSTGQQ
jgi:hypothetical protein